MPFPKQAIVFLSRYFERRHNGYLWRADLRHSIIFLRHNLIQSAPLPWIDLLVCRNTLIYFTEEAQIWALARFHFGLKNNGFLLLGQSENLVTHPQSLLFKPIERCVKAFKEVVNAHRDSRLLAIAF